MILEILAFIFFCLYAWIGTFLWHEFFHIKSQGILNTGKININRYGMTASVDDKHNPEWCKLAGGLLAGLVHLFIGGICMFKNAWYLGIPLITFAVMNIAYGFWEWKKDVKDRWKVYLASLSFMIGVWLIYLWRIGI